MKQYKIKHTVLVSLTILSSVSMMCVTGCAKERSYRGVPEHQWEHLSGEQKQLIIDKAYQDELLAGKKAT